MYSPHGRVRIHSRYVRMTPYSAAADGSFSSRPSSRSAALRDFLREVRQGDELLPQLLDLGLLRVALAELLLDRLQLLPEEVLALALLHLRLHLRLDLRAELEHLELAIEDRRDPPQTLLDVDRLEDLLPLLGLDRAQGGRNEVRKRARVVDVRRRELQLLRQVRREPDDAREEPLHVARQRLHLGCLGQHVGQRVELAEQVRVDVEAVRQPDAVEALDEDAQRAVGHLDHLVDESDGADLVQVVPARRVDRRIPCGHEREQPVARDDVVDQSDRALLPDRERRHRLREDDGVLERQHRECGRVLEGLVDELRRLERDVAHGELESGASPLTPARPRS